MISAGTDDARGASDRGHSSGGGWLTTEPGGRDAQ